MRSLWRGHSNPLAWWWAMLALVSATNVALWIILWRQMQFSHAQPAAGLVGIEGLLVLCAVYVVGCAFRSLLPRADVQRICLFDTWLSSVVIGRSVATLAELCFAAQWAALLLLLGEIAGSDMAIAVGWAVVPLIFVAQCCSWYGVLTTNTLANAIENSIWAVVFGLIALALCRLMPEFDGTLRLPLLAAIAGIAGYIGFLITVDVPMYLNRWRDGRARGRRHLRPLEGLRDVSTRWVVTHDLAHWRGEIAWMSLYFSGAVWASLALCLVYAMASRLPG